MKYFSGPEDFWYKSGEMHWQYFNWKTFLLIDWSLILLINGCIWINLKMSAVLFLKNFEFFFYYIKPLKSIIKLNHITINFYLIFSLCIFWLIIKKQTHFGILSNQQDKKVGTNNQKYIEITVNSKKKVWYKKSK